MIGVPLSAAARALACSRRTLDRWLRSGAPVAQRGGRGRGRQTLVDVQALRAWRRSHAPAENAGDRLLVIAAEVPGLIGDAMHEAFIATDGPHKRLTAGVLAGAGYLAICGVLDRLRRDAPEVPELDELPEKLDTLRRISAD